MRYLLELTPAAILFSLVAALMVPYLGFLVGIALLALALVTIVSTAFGAAIAASVFFVRSVRRVRARMTRRRADRQSGRIEAELTRLGAR